MTRTKTSSITALALATLGGCGKLPPDEVGAQMMHFDKLRNQRYAEIFQIVGNPLTKEYKAGIYNTLGLNSPKGAGDITPQALMGKVDVDAIKQEFGVLKVHKNRPRIWTLDWIDIKAGKMREFNGLQACWVMLLDVPKELVSGGSVGNTYDRTRWPYSNSKP
ncbi:MAG: hypothetical protein FIA96_00530 [Betaproteobacteria bacterium]|nr:hypothetical protein [Betaproteobacteria bacterium]